MEHVPNKDPSLLNNQMAITGPVSTNPVSCSVVKQPETVFARSNVGLPIPLLPTKRKAAVAPLVANKRVVHLDAHVNSPRLSQQSGLANKKMMRNESMISKTVSPRVQTSKSKTGPPEVLPKFKHESSEAIRMKMRETLAAALSVDNQDKDNICSEGKSVPQEVGSTAIKPNLAPGFKAGSTEGENSLYNYVMPDTDASFSDAFFIKDELLQGNGLSWVWDMEVAELKEAQTDENSNSVPMVSSPQELAVRIEAELFKLFGGVTKKYKEKGRSLVFNLKDPNNPELREKVVSTDISPERLCSMTPEELASKELSEWRMAKAEELDKMIVLPDSEVDMRRLVKKTHKGEYQVEVDQDNDDGVSVEVSVGSSSLTRFTEKTTKRHLSSSADDEVKDKVVTVSADGSDLMQELIVDDEFKDEGLLPPIVSLDEFMESLDSEPPFETLPVDGKETKAQVDKDKSECDDGDNGKVSSGATSASHVESKANTNNNLKVNNSETNETSEERKLSPPFDESACECLWEGDLQLTLSSMVPVIGAYKSGEKTSTKEWPGSMEIKGRVKLEAFEKFLQELPMSRSRAVMVVHFVLKDASSEYHQTTLSEAVDSYVAEERVGFGEPNPGVEVYLCPPHKRITDALSSRLLSKEHIDIVKAVENGLIGVVVWRRAQPSSNMLHHKHHRKHLSSRRQKTINSNTNFNVTSKSLCFQPLESDSGDNVVDDDDVPPGFGPGVVARNEDDLPEFNFSRGSNSSGQTLPISAQSGLVSRTALPGPVSHMRQRIHEYGQTGNSNNNTYVNSSQDGIRGSRIENRPWNKDDDDDIPEWKPQLPNNSIHELSRAHLVNQVRSIMGQVVNPVMPIQQPVTVMQNGWVLPPASHGFPPNAILPGQYYSGNWQQNDPRGGGF